MTFSRASSIAPRIVNSRQAILLGESEAIKTLLIPQTHIMFSLFQVQWTLMCSGNICVNYKGQDLSIICMQMVQEYGKIIDKTIWCKRGLVKPLGYAGKHKSLICYCKALQQTKSKSNPSTCRKISLQAIVVVKCLQMRVAEISIWI